MKKLLCLFGHEYKESTPEEVKAFEATLNLPEVLASLPTLDTFLTCQRCKKITLLY